MSLFRNRLDGMMEEKVSRSTSTVTGKIKDYDKATNTCTVEIANLSGGGIIRLQNRLMPDTQKGIISGSPRDGEFVILNIPNGQYTHAQIVSMLPPNEDYASPDYTSQTMLPRTGTVLPNTGKLN